MEILILIFCLWISLGIYQSIMKGIHRNKALTRFKNLHKAFPGFQISQAYYNSEGKSMILMDAQNKQFLFAEREIPKFLITPTPVIREKIVNFNQILKSDIITDGQTISTKSASGALAGGLLFGTAGAIVGSNTGKTTYKKTVNNVKLKLLLNDLNTPSHEVTFYDKKLKGNARQSQIDSQLWQDRMGVILSGQLT